MCKLQNTVRELPFLSILRHYRNIIYNNRIIEIFPQYFTRLFNFATRSGEMFGKIKFSVIIINCNILPDTYSISGVIAAHPLIPSNVHPSQFCNRSFFSFSTQRTLQYGHRFGHCVACQFQFLTSHQPTKWKGERSQGSTRKSMEFT